MKRMLPADSKQHKMSDCAHKMRRETANQITVYRGQNHIGKLKNRDLNNALRTRS